MYGVQTGYEKIYPRKHTAKVRSSPRHVFQTVQPPQRSQGREGDIVKAWEQLYKTKQWHRFAQFDKKGGFNRPYILFKAKNITDHETRRMKWSKCRPIAPQTKHPMKRLFHLTGRAWAYITSHLVSDNFVINHGGQVTKFMQEAEAALRNKGQIACVVKDIEGCFPNMDKDFIRLALRSELHKIEMAHGYDAMTVPRRKETACTFKVTKRARDVRIPFEDLIDIMEFALDNTILRDFEGQLWRQAKGIPMGDPHSPGMTIGTCAWMEHEWLQSINGDSQSNFKARRYMDDLLVFYARNDSWDEARFLQDIGGHCYLPPLKLEDGTAGTFLETSFEITGNTIRHWLKNENVTGEPPKIWRYSHFDSHGQFSQKKATLMACLTKVQKMASDDPALRKSAMQKVAEFARLRYPRKMLWTACTTMGVSTRCPAWFRAREQIPYA